MSHTERLLTGCILQERRDEVARRKQSFARALELAAEDFRPATKRTRLIGLQPW